MTLHLQCSGRQVSMQDTERPLEHEEHEASKDEDYGSEAATYDFEVDSLGDEADAAQDEDPEPEVGDLMKIDGGVVAAFSNLHVEGAEAGGCNRLRKPWRSTNR